MENTKENIYIQTVGNYRIFINSSKITSDIDQYLENYLKREMEGKCRPDGYVRPDSVHLLKRTLGAITGNHFTGKVTYDLVYSSEICNPVVGNVIQARITNINKLGFLAENGPLMIIVPRMYIENKSSGFTELEVGQEIKIEVVAKRFQLNDSKIEIFGKIFNPNESNTPNPSKPAKNPSQPIIRKGRPPLGKKTEIPPAIIENGTGIATATGTGIVNGENEGDITSEIAAEDREEVFMGDEEDIEEDMENNSGSDYEEDD